MYGGSFWVQVKVKKDDMTHKVYGFLHKINFSPELKDEELKIPCKINNKIMIKEVNYL
jgi:hypothetical protein